MNIDQLLHKYFSNHCQTPSIEVFDNQNVHDVYRSIIGLLNRCPDIELSVLQGLGYCFYEILDNVITHSEKLCGTIITRYIPEKSVIQILVADDGIGIQCSLATNEKYADISEDEAVLRCIEDGVTDGKGMGFGLYSTARLINNAGVLLTIHSGNSMLVYDSKDVTIRSEGYWQGTIVYFELHTDKVFDPNDMVENRTDCIGQYNDDFIGDNNLEDLW